MTTIQAKVPDYLARLAAEIAEKENTTVDHIISLALSAQIEAWKVRDTMETRARRANPADWQSLLAKVPNVPPMPGDELPADYKK